MIEIALICLAAVSLGLTCAWVYYLTAGLRQWKLDNFSADQIAVSNRKSLLLVWALFFWFLTLITWTFRSLL